MMSNNSQAMLGLGPAKARVFQPFASQANETIETNNSSSNVHGHQVPHGSSSSNGFSARYGGFLYHVSQNGTSFQVIRKWFMVSNDKYTGDLVLHWPAIRKLNCDDSIESKESYSEQPKHPQVPHNIPNEPSKSGSVPLSNVKQIVIGIKTELFKRSMEALPAYSHLMRDECCFSVLVNTGSINLIGNSHLEVVAWISSLESILRKEFGYQGQAVNQLNYTPHLPPPPQERAIEQFQEIGEFNMLNQSSEQEVHHSLQHHNSTSSSLDIQSDEIISCPTTMFIPKTQQHAQFSEDSGGSDVVIQLEQAQQYPLEYRSTRNMLSYPQQQIQQESSHSNVLHATNLHVRNTTRDESNEVSSRDHTGFPSTDDAIGRVLGYCSDNKMELVESELSRGVLSIDDYSVTHYGGDTLLILSCRLGHLAIVELCLRFGASNDPHPDFGQTALQAAVENIHTACARLLLDTAAYTGMDSSIVNHTDLINVQQAPIHTASCIGDVELLRLLLEHGADVALVDSDGRTPLYLASYFGNLDCVALMTEAGADSLVDLQDSQGNTCLHAAVLAGSDDIVKFHLETAADPRIRNNAGESPYDLAMRRGNPTSMAMLREYEASFQHLTNTTTGHQSTETSSAWSDERFKSETRGESAAQVNHVPTTNESKDGKGVAGDQAELDSHQVQHTQNLMDNANNAGADYNSYSNELHQQGNNFVEEAEVWDEYYNDDGYPYYISRNSGVSQWENPQGSNTSVIVIPYRTDSLQACDTQSYAASSHYTDNNASYTTMYDRPDTAPARTTYYDTDSYRSDPLVSHNHLNNRGFESDAYASISQSNSHGRHIRRFRNSSSIRREVLDRRLGESFDQLYWEDDAMTPRERVMLMSHSGYPRYEHHRDAGYMSEAPIRRNNWGHRRASDVGMERYNNEAYDDFEPSRIRRHFSDGYQRDSCYDEFTTRGGDPRLYHNSGLLGRGYEDQCLPTRSSRVVEYGTDYGGPMRSRQRPNRRHSNFQTRRNVDQYDNEVVSPQQQAGSSLGGSSDCMWSDEQDSVRWERPRDRRQRKLRSKGKRYNRLHRADTDMSSTCDESIASFLSDDDDGDYRFAGKREHRKRSNHKLRNSKQNATKSSARKRDDPSTILKQENVNEEQDMKPLKNNTESNSTSVVIREPSNNNAVTSSGECETSNTNNTTTNHVELKSLEPVDPMQALMQQLKERTMKQAQKLENDEQSATALKVENQSSLTIRVTNDSVMPSKAQLESYIQLAKCGVSEGNIKQKMVLDGFGDQAIQTVLQEATKAKLTKVSATILPNATHNLEERDSSTVKPIDVSPQKPQHKKLSEEQLNELRAELKNNSKFEKYFKMLKMRLPTAAVVQKMNMDGLSKSEVEKFCFGFAPELIATSEPNCQDESDETTVPELSNDELESLRNDLKQDSKFEKYFKMFKMKLPAQAVVQKMNLDGLTQQEINKFCVGFAPELISGKSSKRESGSAKAKTSLKKLHWNAIPKGRLANSVWANRNVSQGGELEQEDMEELIKNFSSKPASAGTDRTSNRTSRSLGNKSQEVRLLDLKRANNVNIGLAQFRHLKVPHGLVNAIQHAHTKVLTPTKLTLLKGMLPSSSEIRIVTEYKGDIKKLGKAEHFFLVLAKLDQFAEKIETLLFMSQFCDQSADILKTVQLVSTACSQVLNSARLQQLFGIILKVGNTMNAGTFKGGVDGFTLDSLLKLVQTRANDNRSTIVDYITKTAHKKGGMELLNYSKDLEAIEGASRVHVSDVKRMAAKLVEGMDRVEEFLTNLKSNASLENGTGVCDAYVPLLTQFVSHGQETLSAVGTSVADMEVKCREAASYLGEDPDEGEHSQMFKVLKQFNDHISFSIKKLRLK